MPARWIMTDPDRLAHPDDLHGDLTGCGLIVRHYGVPDRHAIARTFVTACQNRTIPVLIAGDWRLAAALRADGVHLPEWLVPRRASWRRANPGWIVTAAAHSERAAMKAIRARADGLIVSPVLPTVSHPGARTLGPQGLARIIRFARRDGAYNGMIYGLGGLSQDRFERLAWTGMDGWAGIGAWV